MPTRMRGPRINIRLVEEFCGHYTTVVLAARPAHPRDKPKVEVGVQVVERWILARLRHRRLFSLAEANTAIAELLIELNARPFKKLPGCRASAFASLDRPALRPLPATGMVIARFVRVRVNIDYHFEVDRHFYSVPHRLVHAQLEVRVTDTTVEAFLGQQRVACPCLQPPAGQTHHVARAHAGVAPRAPGVDPSEAQSPGARRSAPSVGRSCAGKWRTARTPSRATAPAWG
jgi:Mu transposase-like protein